jgi:hypothetical protein
MAGIRRFEIVSAVALLTQPSSPGLTGGSSTPRLFASITSALEYWIAAGACHRAALCADPLAGDDG